MPNVKRLLSVILILALALMAFGGLGGCSGKKKPLRILLDLSWASGEAESAMGEFLAEVERRGGPVDVEIETLPTVGEDEAARDAAITRLRTEIMAGGGPDVFIVAKAHDWDEKTNSVINTSLFLMPEKSKELGLFYPLDDYIANAQFMEWDKLTPVVMEAGRGEQGQAILPMTYQLPLTYFRQADADHTPSAALTWQDMLSGDDPILEIGALGALRQWGSMASPVVGRLADVEENQLLFTEEELRTRIQEWIGLEQADREGKYQEPAHFSSVLRKYFDRTGNVGAAVIPDLQTSMENGPLEPLAMVPVYSDDGGITVNIDVYGAINANTRRPDDAFFILDLLLSAYGQQQTRLFGGFLGDGVPTYEGVLSPEMPSSVGNYSLTAENYAAFCAVRKAITGAHFTGTLDHEILRLYRACSRIQQGLAEGDADALIRQAYSRMEKEVGE